MYRYFVGLTSLSVDSNWCLYCCLGATEENPGINVLVINFVTNSRSSRDHVAQYQQRTLMRYYAYPKFLIQVVPIRTFFSASCGQTPFHYCTPVCPKFSCRLESNSAHCNVYIPQELHCLRRTRPRGFAIRYA